MLRYEVNKNVAVSPKNSSSQYQFEQTERKDVRSLLLVGESGKSISDGLFVLNYDYETFDDAVQAFKFLESRVLKPRELPDAIICDLELNDGDAYTLFNKIQKDHFLKTLPFIIVCRKNCEDVKRNALQMGVDDFYTVPFEMEDLHNRITFLKQFKKEKAKLNVAIEQRFENKISLLKRTFDIIISLTALLILSPILTLVALIIKLESRGPILYISKRVGTGYQIFDLYKFRSMKQGADVELKNLLHLNQYSEGDSTFVKLENDPRVTRWGRFLRASSIDEIPQLLNVIKGDMSIVGNRPLPLYEAEQLTKDVWAKRFLAPAGLTGLWQVSRRGQEEMSVSERVILDNTYADQCSFFLDMKIILKTFPALISKINS